jgi:hypothetical protein
MTDKSELTPVMIERAIEQLRQEKETFDQAKKHESLWFYLRLSMGFTSIVLLGAIMIISVYILFNHVDFTPGVVTSAGMALFGDVGGLLLAVWKIVLNPKSATKLSPVTGSSIPDVLN